MGLFDLFKPNIRRMILMNDVEGLIQAMKHKDWHIRERAVMAFSYIGDTKAIEPIIQALKDRHKSVRLAASLILGFMVDERAVKPLIQNLKDKHSSVRYGAAGALGSIGEKLGRC